MATTAFTGMGITIPPAIGLTLAPAFTNFQINVTGAKSAMIGSVFFNGTGTKDIERLQFRFGSVTKAGGSAMTLSLQDVDTANGPVIRPDGTQDQTVAIANADAGFAANTWYRTGTLSANRTVSNGDLLAMVLEFDGGGRLGADTVSLSGLALSSGVTYPINQQGSCVDDNTGSTWTVRNVLPCIILEFSDGTFGTFWGSIPAKTVNTHAFASNSGADEYALKITTPFELDLDAVGGFVAPGTGANFDLVLYSGTTALATCSVDANAINSTSPRPITRSFEPETGLSAGDYYVSFKPTTTTNITVYSYDVDNVAFLDLLGPFGREITYATRVDAGSWTETTTRRLFAWAGLSGVPTAGGGGGGLAANPIRGFVG